MEYEQPWNMGKVLLERCQRSNVSLCFQVPGVKAWVWIQTGAVVLTLSCNMPIFAAHRFCEMHCLNSIGAWRPLNVVQSALPGEQSLWSCD